jgi:hypothetical protein
VQRRIRYRVGFVHQQHIGPLAVSNFHEIATMNPPDREAHVCADTLRHIRKQSLSRAGAAGYYDNRRLKPDLPDDLAQCLLKWPAQAPNGVACIERI